MTLFPWHLLSDPGLSIVSEATKKYSDLISLNSTGERECLSFLAKLPAFFLMSEYSKFLVLSELEIGQFRPDFVIVSDDRSLGPTYELIELQSPNDKIFNRNGELSAGLREADRQIKEWKGWINQNRQEVEKIFITTRHNIAFTYTIIIGRREEFSKLSFAQSTLLEQYMSDGGYKVRSFDSLADNIRNRRFNPLAHIANKELAFPLPIEFQNALANPFIKALGSSQWKSALYGSKDFAHTFTKNHQNILSNISINELELDKFKNYLKTLTTDKLDHEEKNIKWAYSL